MSRRTVLPALLLVVLVGAFFGGDAAHVLLLSPARGEASSIYRISIIERAFEVANIREINPDTQIYTARVPIRTLERWLRESEIQMAAQVQGRPVNEVRAEWDSAGVGFLPPQIIADHPYVWVVDIRNGVNYQAGDDVMPVTLPPVNAVPPGWEPPHYDNIHVILADDGSEIGLGAFANATMTPPLGPQVEPGQIHDSKYLVEVAPLQGESRYTPGSDSFKVYLPSLQTNSGIAPTRHVSIIEYALALMRYDSIRIPGEASEVSAIHTPIGDLESWLREGAIAQTAAIQDRPVDEVRTEWDRVGMTFLPPHLLNAYDQVWFIDVRGGIQYRPGPGIPPPGGSLPTYDNVHMILDDTGGSLGVGAFSDTSYWTPPLGPVVPPEQWNSDAYIIEIPWP